jgi:hypothetical protein
MKKYFARTLGLAKIIALDNVKRSAGVKTLFKKKYITYVHTEVCKCGLPLRRQSVLVMFVLDGEVYKSEVIVCRTCYKNYG